MQTDREFLRPVLQGVQGKIAKDGNLHDPDYTQACPCATDVLPHSRFLRTGEAEVSWKGAEFNGPKALYRIGDCGFFSDLSVVDLGIVGRQPHAGGYLGSLGSSFGASFRTEGQVLADYPLLPSD